MSANRFCYVSETRGLWCVPPHSTGRNEWKGWQNAAATVPRKNEEMFVDSSGIVHWGNSVCNRTKLFTRDLTSHLN
ncbi:hypothetical protein CEXT_410221 [Caerostris extrusa]|uniref:Uncharacterized protein n=1 Tax=Caerostris extrusa TaxID=172846 RepID=A0AAV4TK92_CAEEX|nr:hypothetical protein CEXT_410221 [Caerostris extrusa]